MPDTEQPQEAVASAQDDMEAVAASRRALRDLAALLVLPTMWVDHDPAYIAAGLLGVLFSMLRLDIGYARFDDPTGGPALERWRPEGLFIPSTLKSLVMAAPAREQGVVTVTVATSDSALRVTSMSPTLPGEDGLVLVGSRRADFPTEYELHTLQAAVGQATISIHMARRLAVERAARITAEAALRLRNAYLESLSQELMAPLATLSKRIAQAHALATESDHSPDLASAAMDVAADAGGAFTLDADTPSLTPPARLSRREAEVLGLLAQGLSNKEIGGVLWLSERTVERHVTSLYRKIGVERRSEATAFALRHRLVAADTDEE